MRELRAGRLVRLGALLGQAVDAEEFRVRVGGRPFGEEDVVFEIEGGEVADVVAEGVDGGADVGGEGDGGEDGEGAGLEADWRKGGEWVSIGGVGEAKGGGVWGKGEGEGGGGTYGASAADFEAAEAREGGGADGDVGGEFADDHHAGGVWGDEFG